MKLNIELKYFSQSLGDEQRVRSNSDIDLISIVVLLVERLYRCHICRKLIKSRLFLPHLKMHNDKQRNSGSSSRMLRRPNTRGIASSRKRGRPRKFWSFSLASNV